MSELAALDHAVDNAESPYAVQLRKNFRNLRFVPELEEEFRESWNEAVAERARTPLIAAMILFTAFGVVDVFTMPLEVIAVSLGARLAFAFPIMAIGVLVLGKPHFYKYGVRAAAAIVIAVALAQLAINYAAYQQGIPKAYEGLILNVMFVHFYTGIYFLPSAFVSFGIAAGYCAVGLYTGIDDRMVLNNTLYLSCSAVVGLMGGYLIEYQTRANFLRASLLNSMLMRDPLTNLHNRHFFESQLQGYWDQADTEEVPIALARVGIDNFADYNSAHGRAEGDALLARIAPILTNKKFKPSVRLAARHGGSEFVLVWYDRPVKDILAVLEQAKQQAAQQGVDSQTLPLSIGLSYGQPGLGQPVGDLLYSAEVALAKARKAGGDRLHMELLKASSEYELDELAGEVAETA